MNQKLWSGFTAATLLLTTMGIAPLTYADQPQSNDEVSEPAVPTQESAPQDASTSTLPMSSSDSANASSAEAVKVGEYQAQEQAEAEDSITEIFPHAEEGRQAATLYVRNIPVLTFLGSNEPVSSNDLSETSGGNASETEVKVASVQPPSSTNAATESIANKSNQSVATSGAGTDNADNEMNPVWRATAIAARLNQFHWDSVDANTITAAWNAEKQHYAVMVGEDELVEVGADTQLPGSTHDPAQDALRIANLLRRQLGNAAPLQSVSGDPGTNATQISLGPIQFSFTGMASWYGPGFDGNYSASGEVFNQNALTAAHRTLPFGTLVRVTNLDTGLSVVVRINDRGPFAYDRVIDLSTAAAQTIGLVQSGVAPVNLEVVNQAQSISSNTR